MTAPITDGRVLRANAQRENRRTEILEAALRVFSRKGYHQTRVSDVLAEAGIARGTFYLYFDSKGAVFLELLDQLLDHLRASVVGVDQGGDAPPVAHQLYKAVRRIISTVASNRPLTRIIIREAVGLDAEVDHRLRGFYGNLLQYLRAALIEGRRMGVVRSLDAEVAAMCILGSFKQVMEYCILTDEEIDVDHLAHAILDFNLRGTQK